jgi:hypothetical protein
VSSVQRWVCSLLLGSGVTQHENEQRRARGDRKPSLLLSLPGEIAPVRLDSPRPRHCPRRPAQAMPGSQSSSGCLLSVAPPLLSNSPGRGKPSGLFLLCPVLCGEWRSVLPSAAQHLPCPQLLGWLHPSLIHLFSPSEARYHV